MSLITKDMTILFQGDSITDCGRERDDITSLGFGYAHLVASRLLVKKPGYNLKFINKGISGNRVRDLEARWEEDCIDLKPDLVSILIGINDVWRRYDHNDATSTQDFEDTYRRILLRVKKELGVPIVILEPFVLPVQPSQAEWREDLDPKIHAVRRLAREFGAAYVPLDGIFAAATVQQEPAFWAYDGVHPSLAGHDLIADAWLKAVGEL